MFPHPGVAYKVAVSPVAAIAPICVTDCPLVVTTKFPGSIGVSVVTAVQVELSQRR